MIIVVVIVVFGRRDVRCGRAVCGGRMCGGHVARRAGDLERGTVHRSGNMREWGLDIQMHGLTRDVQNRAPMLICTSV